MAKSKEISRDEYTFLYSRQKKWDNNEGKRISNSKYKYWVMQMHKLGKNKERWWITENAQFTIRLTITEGNSRHDIFNKRIDHIMAIKNIKQMVFKCKNIQRNKCRQKRYSDI